MRQVHIFTIILLTATCGGEFNPDISNLTEGDDSGTDDSGSTGTGTTGDTETNSGSTDDSGTTGDTETDTGSTDDTADETGDPPGNPGPDEPCDPLLAFEGIAPCEHPEGLPLTCAIVRLMPDIDTVTFEFRCLAGPGDGYGDGYDLGDNCSDNGGGQGGVLISTGCFNSFCLWNGDAVNNEPWGHPPGECPFVLPDEMGYSFGCCSMYCDADHPCEPGWTCQMGAPAVSEIPQGYGACVWL